MDEWEATNEVRWVMNPTKRLQQMFVREVVAGEGPDAEIANEEQWRDVPEVAYAENN